jgi:hypothetical protein
MDESLLRSVFHPEAKYIHGEVRGSIEDFVPYALAMLAGFRGTHHVLSNMLINVRGGSAVGESYYVAYHRQALSGRADGLAAFATGSAEDVIVGGRYIDRFVHTGTEWLIAERRNVRDWESWRPADERQMSQFPPAMLGSRDSSDPSYRVLGSADNE